VAGAIAILAALGAWAGFQLVRERRALRRAFTSVCWLLAATTIVVSLALGFEGQYKHFRLHNVPLLDKLEHKLSICPPP
jgi:hypothetical protein